jgi:sacsin
VYTPEKISQLLDSLRSEVQLMMLFLKHLSSIQVWEWAEGAASPTLTFSCTIDNPPPTLKMDRNMFSKVSGAFHEMLSSMQQSDLDDDGSRALVRAPSSASLGRLRQGTSSSFQLELNSTDHSRASCSVRRFLVSQASAGGEAADMALELSKHLSAPLVPWGAVAADITVPTDDSVAAPPIAPGQAFCFLPLPALTGLPVHINGFFELSSNRRDIWHGSDLAGAGALRARWNTMLLEQAVAPAYAALLEAATSLLGQSKAFDRLWPQSDVRAPWQDIVPPLYQMAAELPVAWTAASPGRWFPPTHCLLPDEHCLEGHGHGYGPVESDSPGGGRALRDGLVHIGLPLLGLDATIVQMMGKHMVRRWWLYINSLDASSSLSSVSSAPGQQATLCVSHHDPEATPADAKIPASRVIPCERCSRPPEVLHAGRSPVSQWWESRLWLKAAHGASYPSFGQWIEHEAFDKVIDRVMKLSVQIFRYSGISPGSKYGGS